MKTYKFEKQLNPMPDQQDRDIDTIIRVFNNWQLDGQPEEGREKVRAYLQYGKQMIDNPEYLKRIDKIEEAFNAKG